MLADWPGLAGLLRLDLGANKIGDAGAAALAGSRYLPSGLRLDLGDNHLTDGVGLLRERLGRRLSLGARGG